MVNLKFSHDLSTYEYDEINPVEFRFIELDIQVSWEAAETRVPFNTENFSRGLGAFPSLSGFAKQDENEADVSVTVRYYQGHWTASIVEEVCAWQKPVLRARVA
eukprot:scpid108233/ scgid1395/ 